MKTFPCAHRASLPVQARDICLSGREQWVVSHSAPHLSPGCLPGRDAGHSRWPSTPPPSGPALSVFLPAQRKPRCIRFSSRCEPCGAEASVDRRARRQAQPGRGAERGSLEAAAHWSHWSHWSHGARPISASSRGQPSCLRAAHLSALITETLHAYFGWELIRGRINNALGFIQPRVKRRPRGRAGAAAAAAGMRGAAAGAGRWGCGQRPVGSMLSPKIRQARRGECASPAPRGVGTETGGWHGETSQRRRALEPPAECPHHGFGSCCPAGRSPGEEWLLGENEA